MPHLDSREYGILKFGKEINCRNRGKLGGFKKIYTEFYPKTVQKFSLLKLFLYVLDKNNKQNSWNYFFKWR